jgi:hypothetical protein
MMIIDKFGKKSRYLDPATMKSLPGEQIMTPANGSGNLPLRLITMFIVLVIVGFVIPLETLESNELLVLWMIMPFIGWLWIQICVDAAKS